MPGHDADSPAPGAFDTAELLDAMTGAAVVLDGAGRFVTANARWTRFCIDHDDFVVALRPGDDFLELCIDERRPIAQGVRSVIRRDIATFSFLYPCRTADGDRWIRVEAAPVADGALVTHVDVGDEYAHLGEWLAGGVEGVVELDPSLQPTFVSRAWLERSDRELWTAPLDEVAVVELWDRLTRCLVDHETFSLGLAGGDRWYRVAVSPDVDTHGAVRRIVIMISDVTSRRSSIARAAAESERSRVAAELHDTAVQRLYATALALQRMEAQEQADPQVIETTIQRLDRTIADLRTLGRPGPRAAPLAETLAQVVDDATAALDFAPSVDIDVALTELSAEVAEHLPAVLTESLSNVARHAGASACSVQIVERTGHLVLVVTDNGRGMPTGRTRASGTANIGQRAESLGGLAEWSPGPGGGTVLTWQVPLGGAAGEPDAGVR